MDHVIYPGLNFLINTSDTMTATKVLAPWNTHLLDYFYHKKGPFTCSAPQSVGFINTKNTKARVGSTDMELLYIDTSALFGEPYVLPRTLGLKTEVYDKLYTKYIGRYAFQILTILTRPKSRGKLTLASRDINDQPKLLSNYYTHPDDVRAMIQGIRETIELTKTKALQEFGSSLLPEAVSGCQDLKTDSNEYWECAIRTLTMSVWHYSGTAKMGPNNDTSAVVDERLRVSLRSTLY